MQSEKLIESLIEQTRQIINQVEKLKTEHLDRLTRKENQNSWSVLECLEHLNLYGDFYLPEMNSKITQSKSVSENTFKSGWLGGYFAKSMLPKDKLNKMKTFKDKNPLNAKLDKSVIDKFLNQQIQLLDLLNRARKVNLNSVRISTSISKLIKLKLGDTFMFYVNHMIRHMKQIERVLNLQ